MARVFIFTDESGDLGWKFDMQYRGGGSSRHLSIASVIADEGKRHLPKRVVQKLYKKFNINTAVELKWSGMNSPQKAWFADRAAQLVQTHPGIKLRSITVYKPNVADHIRQDENKLYNYMTRLSLIATMKQAEEVVFIPDERSIKVKSGSSLHDYLVTTLWFEEGVSTKLSTLPSDSASNRGVQFADMLAGLVQEHFEDGKDTHWAKVAASLNAKRLYFP